MNMEPATGGSFKDLPVEEENGNQGRGNDGMDMNGILEEITKIGAGDGEGEEGGWGLPANYTSLKLEAALQGESAWQLVKRPWEPTKEQKSKAQLADEKRKEKVRKERAAARAKRGGESDAEGEDDEEEPGTTTVEEKFHYYWRLSAPEPYKRAGAVGKRWRAVHFNSLAETIDELDKGELHWIVDARWQEECRKKNGSVKYIAVFDKYFAPTGRTFGDLKIMEWKHNKKRTRRLKWKELYELVTNYWYYDDNLQTAAQEAATGPDILAQSLPSAPGNPVRPFQYEDGTFVDSRGSLEACPTSEDENGDVHRLYIKLRSTHVKFLDTSGGLIDPGRDDVFILKTKMEKLARIVDKHGKAEEDPLLETIEAREWTSDCRLQEPKDGNSVVDHLDGNTRPGNIVPDSTPANQQLNNSHQRATHDEVSFWVRNGRGFAFKFTTRVRQAESWAKNRREAIRSVESDRGWCRYIDPAIDLYIVPVSPDAPMQVYIYETMKRLDMPRDRIEVSERLGTQTTALFRKLPSPDQAKPECATTKIYLLQREDIRRDQDKPLVKLAVSPFNHYETWITEGDWKSYIKARPDRPLPVHPKDEAMILLAKKTLETKGKETKIGKENALIQKGRKARKTKNRTKKGGNKKEDKAIVEEKDSDEVQNPNTTNLEIRVSSVKLHKAAGTRQSAAGQAAVMGCSATLIAKSLKWRDHNVKTPAGTWPGTTHMPAEWLHRCAYSWGGLDDDPNSSQVPGNLIFGTGECNSVMTRYEKAWQELVRREGDRHDPEIGGRLYANINRKWYRQQFCILGEQNETAQPMGEEAQEKNLPPWLCYALDYILVLDQTAEPFNANTFQTVFYPWQRGFFTKFEQVLDEVVLELAYTKNSKPREKVKEKGGRSAGKGERAAEKAERKANEKHESQMVESEESDKGLDEELGNNDNSRVSEDGLLGKREYSEYSDEGENDIRDFPDEEGSEGKEKLEKKPKFEGQAPTYGLYSLPVHQLSHHVQNPQSSEHQDDSTNTQELASHFAFFETMQVSEKPNLKGLSTAKMTRVTGKRRSGSFPEPSKMSEAAKAEVEYDQADDRPETNFTRGDGGCISPTAAEPQAHLHAIWEEVHAPGPTTLLDGLVLSDAAVVMGPSTSPDEDSSSVYFYPVASAVGNQLGTPAEPELKEAEAWGQIVNVPVVEALQEPVYSSMMHGEKEGIKALARPDLEPEFHVSSKIKAVPQSKLETRQPDFLSTNDDKQNTASQVPPKFVVTGTFKLFGLHTSILSSLQVATSTPRSTQSLAQAPQTYHIELPTNLSLGTLLPPLADSQLDAIGLNNTTFTYASNGREDASLSVHTTITLSGFLQPVNTLLRDVLGQKRPRIEVNGVLSTVPLPECLTRVPQPLAFVLTGELPEVSVNLFGVLTITHIGIEVNGTRKSSAGGYRIGYGFFGRGRISATTNVGWRISRFGEKWSISIHTESTSWTDVAGIDGVDLKDVFLEASWLGTKIATARLDLRATFSIKEQATLMLRGQFAKDNFEVAGYLEECNLTTLKQLYNQTFDAGIDVTTEHNVVISSMVLIVSKSSGVTLYGAVSVDGHEAAEAFVHIGAGAIEFEGSLTGSLSVGPVAIEQPSLAMAIYTSRHCHGGGFMVKFAGKVSISDKHKAEVFVYLERSKGKPLDYTVYGAYEGELCLHDLLSVLGETDLLRDVKMRRVAVCVSSADRPAAQIAGKPTSYSIGKGLAVYAEVSLPVVSKVLSVDESRSFVVCASYRPPSAQGEGFKVDISICIPDQNAFKIGGFSVGNIALAVQVIESLPSIKISGDLTFPVEDGKKLIMALGLSAGIYEAKGEAELKTDWENPLSLSRAVTIRNLKAGLGILYVGSPSSVTLGGAVVVGSVSGSVLIHTGTDPKQQLLEVRLRNLDVAALLKAVGGLIGVDLTIPGGNDAFFVRKLDVYLSTGCEVLNVYYPRGIRLDVDMTLFGKRATLFAEIQKGHVVIKGSVEKFKLGPLEVCAASSPDKDPSVDIELSSSTQRIRIDGKVIFGHDNWVMLLVDIDTCKGAFYAHFELVIGDELMILVQVKLEGGLPPAKQDRVHEIQDAKNDKLGLPQPLPHPQPPPTIDGGLLQGKTFTVHAEVQKSIVDYLMKLANDHLGGERDPAELAHLQAVFEKAEAALREAEARYSTVKSQSDAAIAKATAGLDQEAAGIRNQIAAEQKRMGDKVARLEEDARNLVLQSAQDERDLAEKEAREAAEADATARKANTELEAWRGRVHALRVADMAEQTAAAVLEATEMELANAQAAVMRHERIRPVDDGTDPAYEPWRWEHADLESVAASLEIKVAEAAEAVKAARDGIVALGMGTVEEAEAELERLANSADEADDAAIARRAAIPGNLEAGRMAAKKKRENLQKSRADAVAHGNKTIEDLRTREAASVRDRADRLAAARAKNDPLKSEAGKAYEKALQTRRAVDVKLRSYRNLKSSISGAGEVLLTPLRFAVNVVGKGLKKLLNIKSIVIDGSLRDTSGKVRAAVRCTVGGYDWDWTLEIDLGDIVSFFNRLWDKIKSVISSVADSLLDLAKKGTEAVKQFCNTIGTEARKIADNARRTTDEFLKDLARAENQVREFMADIDRAALQPFIRAAEEALREVDRKLQQVNREIKNAAVEMERDLNKLTIKIGGTAIGVIRDIDRGVDKMFRGIRGFIGFATIQQHSSAGIGFTTNSIIPDEEEIRHMLHEIETKSVELSKQYQKLEDLVRQNRETKPKGQERDKAESELRMRQRQIEVYRAELGLEKEKVEITASMMVQGTQDLAGLKARVAEFTQATMQLQRMQWRLVIRQLRREKKKSLEGAEMKQVVVDIEIEEIRLKLVSGKDDVEAMRLRDEDPERIMRRIRYLEKLMGTMNRKREQLK
ncbi:hypothetical protein V8F06_005378 [Rhypophila decipiens]